MNHRISFQKNTMTVFLQGEMDHHSARQIREITDGLIRQKHPRELRLDFSSVSFMDSSGIGLIMGRYRIMSLYDGVLRVVNVPEPLRKMMMLSGLDALDITERREKVYDRTE